MKSLLLALIPMLFLEAAVAFAQPPSPSANDEAAIAKGNNAFAVELYGQLRKQGGNLFFSPASISTALGMAYAGARGATAEEMAGALDFALPAERLHPALGAFLGKLNAAHTGYELHAADALWAQQDEAFLPDYLALTKTDYGAGFHPVDFKSAPEQVRATINAWVAQQTADKIKDLLQPGALDPTTRLVLTNAIYFKAAWATPFRIMLTEDKDFHLSATQTVKAPMMTRVGGFAYFNGGSFQALEIPYKAGELSMIVLLPNKVDGLAALEAKLTAASMEEWLGKLDRAPEVVLSLPRFKTTQQFELTGALAALGMRKAFDQDTADFSAMTGKKDLWISAAIHKAFVDVNEEGTEAAAATAVTMVAGAMMRRDEPPPILFNADHPFLFAIRENGSKAILFMGRVTDPTK
jgi:serpin B